MGKERLEGLMVILSGGTTLAILLFIYLLLAH